VLLQPEEVRQFDKSVGFSQVFAVAVTNCAENPHEGETTLQGHSMSFQQIAPA